MTTSTSVVALPVPYANSRRFNWRIWLLRAGIFMGIASVGSVVLWEAFLEKQFVAKNFGVVEEGRIYRSGQLSEQVIENVLREYKIGTIVFMSADNLKRSFIVKEIETAKQLGINRINCPLAGDGTGDIVEYANAIEAMMNANKAGKRVLVHCHAGSQRTSSVVAFWRMLVQGKPAKDAYAEMLRYNHDPSDNPKLVPYMNQHMRELAQMLVDRKVIDRVPDPLPVIGP